MRNRLWQGARLFLVLGLAFALAPTSASAIDYTVEAGSADVADLNLGDGICDASPAPAEVCTLRAAVQTANSPASPTADRVLLPAGTYTLTIANAAGDENAAATGDLDITANLEVVGLGAGAEIRGNSPTPVDRLLHVPSGGPAVTLSNLTLRGGAAPNAAHGGGIKHESGTLAIDHGVITQNDAPGIGARGGGIYSSASAISLSLTDSAVSGNDAAENVDGGDGGGINAETALTLERVSVSGNTASLFCPGTCAGEGGGIVYAGPPTTFTNVTVSENNAGGSFAGGFSTGGGIGHYSAGELRLVNATVSHNSVNSPVGFGGGNLFTFGGGSDIRLHDTIVAAGSGSFENCSAEVGPAYYSDGNNLEARPGIAGSQCGLSSGVNGDVLAGDAGLGPLAANGGVGLTRALLGSPAIDTGAGCPATDQRGVARPQGPRCDVGAFELEQAPAAAAPLVTQPAVKPGSTLAAALRKCRKKKSKKARKKCVKRVRRQVG